MRNLDPLIILPFLFLLVCLFLLIYLPKRIEKWRLTFRITVQIRNLKKALPDNFFTIVVSPPFVFVSDEEKGDLAVLIDRVMNWIVPKLKAAYFSKPLKARTVIWLLKNRESYKNFVQKYGPPSYLENSGYFSPKKNEIIVDSSHCYGILAHEMVHAFIASNFPSCPAWFNEGLASLYNNCDEEGEIVGVPDRNLSELQSAILAQSILSFEALCALEKREFYHFDKDRYYAQAKYLCYYLQQEGLLKKYFRSFQENHRLDPTGYNTLQKTVGYGDMREFQKDWEYFMLTIPTATGM
jgi:hypothetical protein